MRATDASPSQPDAAADLPARKRALGLRPAARAQRATQAPIPRRPPNEIAPVSFGQEQIWLHSQLVPDVPLYTESLTIHRRGPLDVGALVASFDEIVRRHEIWRTTFVWSHGQLIQTVSPGIEPRVQVADLRYLPENAREVRALELATEDLRRPFDLAREPGVRARLVTLNDGEHRLYLALHHMVFDGVSIYRVFLSELANLYAARMTGAPSALEELSLQYADYAFWQRQTAEKMAFAPLVEYWRKQLAGAPPIVALPTDHPRPSSQSFQGGLVRFHFDRDLVAGVRTTAMDESCTLFMFLLASFAATLYRWARQADLVIGSVSGGRDHSQLERLIGYFMRMLVLRIELGGDPTFREILRRVREVLVGALSHDALPFQRLVQALAPERKLDRSPLFQVTLSIEPPIPAQVGSQWDVSELDAGAAVSKFDLSIELDDRGDVILGRAIYSRDLFEAPTISALLSDWMVLLRSAVADPAQPLRALAGSR